MSAKISNLIEEFANVKYAHISNFQTFYELAVLLISII